MNVEESQDTAMSLFVSDRCMTPGRGMDVALGFIESGCQIVSLANRIFHVFITLVL